jgi:hypothetical protein
MDRKFAFAQHQFQVFLFIFQSFRPLQHLRPKPEPNQPPLRMENGSNDENSASIAKATTEIPCIELTAAFSSTNSSGSDRSPPCHLPCLEPTAAPSPFKTTSYFAGGHRIRACGHLTAVRFASSPFFPISHCFWLAWRRTTLQAQASVSRSMRVER